MVGFEEIIDQLNLLREYLSTKVNGSDRSIRQPVSNDVPLSKRMIEEAIARARGSA